MDLGDLAKKAKDLADEHGDKLDGAIDKAADMAKDRVEGHDDQIDSAAAKAKGLLDQDGGAQSGQA
jgi:hypothetical protein